MSDALLTEEDDLSKRRFTKCRVLELASLHIFVTFLWYVFIFFIFFQPKPIDVNVISHQMQRYAVWFGGSMLASTVKIPIQNLLSNLFIFYS